MVGKENKVTTIVFGGGCFWCTEAVFRMIKGVTSVTPGYAGGETSEPTYETVKTGKTGHAEVVKIEYNPDEVLFRDLLTVFYGTHDPTTPNRQGADIGTEYRSLILYTTTEQEYEANKFITEINTTTYESDAIVTEIRPLEEFFPAENYHKDFYNRNSKNPYCQIVINPKLEKVKKDFSRLVNRNE